MISVMPTPRGQRLTHVLHVVQSHQSSSSRSTNPYRDWQIILWGNVTIDESGTVSKHVGRNKFSEVNKNHVERLNELRIDLVDLFLKHFSNKKSSRELFALRKKFEETIDERINTLNEWRQENKGGDCKRLLHEFLDTRLYLTRERISLSPSVEQKLDSAICVNWRDNGLEQP